MQLKIYEIKWFSLITEIDIELPSFTLLGDDTMVFKVMNLFL